MSRQDQQTTDPTLAHFGQMGEDQISIHRGEGSHVYDTDGKQYLDFVSQLYCVNAGHSNETILGRIRNQLDRIQYVSSAKGSDVRTKFARNLVDVAPESLEDVFFSVSGSEANEAALQIARQQQDAPVVLSRWRSYHGGTYATGGLSGDPAIRSPVENHGASTGNVKFLPPFAGCDSPFDAENAEDLAEQAADHLEYIILNQGPDSIAALITEIVGGSSGAFTAPPGYFDRVRELCDRYDILLIADEVITGFGRCGEWFGTQTENLQPDMITFAKGATSAYIPLAGVLASSEIGSRLRDEQMDIGQTFAGNPLACAAGLGALEEYEHMIDNVKNLEPHFESELRELERYDVVGDVRGRGFHWALEIIDPDTGDPIFDPRIEDGDNPLNEVFEIATEQGVMLGGGRPNFQITLSPPLCTDEAQITEAVDILDDALAEVF